MVNVRVLKFHIQILYEKIVDLYFCLCSSYLPFWSYAPFKTKFENLVCKISQKVFKLEPSYSVHLLGLRRRSPDYILKTCRQILTKLLHFENFTPFLIYLQRACILFLDQGQNRGNRTASGN